MQSLPKPTLLTVQKSQLFWKKLGDDVILVQCPFNLIYWLLRDHGRNQIRLSKHSVAKGLPPPAPWACVYFQVHVVENEESPIFLAFNKATCQVWVQILWILHHLELLIKPGKAGFWSTTQEESLGLTGFWSTTQEESLGLIKFNFISIRDLNKVLITYVLTLGGLRLSSTDLQYLLLLVLELAADWVMIIRSILVWLQFPLIPLVSVMLIFSKYLNNLSVSLNKSTEIC